MATKRRYPQEDTQIDNLSHIEPKGCPPFREFISMVNSAEILRTAGIGLTLDDVIREHQIVRRDLVEEHLKENPDVDPAEVVAEADHIVVWERGRVRAVLIPEPTGKPRFVVTEFDSDGGTHFSDEDMQDVRNAIARAATIVPDPDE